MRLDKFLAHNGFGSRKDVKTLVKKGHVTLNETVIKNPNMNINELQDIIAVDDEIIHYQQYVYIMLHKPANCVCATKDDVHATVLDYIEGYDHFDLFPVGRLDKDTTGLLIISNDGDFAHKLMSPNRNHPKVYHAIIDGFIDEQDIALFKKGVPLKDFKCKSADVKEIERYDSTSLVEVTIYEGKFHQVKRMFIHIGKEVLKLHRVSINGLYLDETLKPGEYRELSKVEFDILKNNL